MRARVSYRQLLRAARALKPYTTSLSPASEIGRLLHLSADGGALTLGVTTYVEDAQVDLDGAVSNGRCVVGLAALLAALTAIRLPGRRPPATVTLSLDGVYLHLQGHPAAGSVTLPTDLAMPGDSSLGPDATPIVVATPAADICAAVTQVGRAGDTAADSDLGVVRFLRPADGRLVIEATDRYRAHRAALDGQVTTPVDARMAIAAITRAVTLLRACDRNGLLTVRANPYRIRWQTDTVRLSSATSMAAFPDLNALRERAPASADFAFVVDRATTHTALTHVAENAGNDALVIVPHPDDGTATISLSTSDDQSVRRATIPASGFTGTPRHLRVRPGHARDAFALFDAGAVTIHLPPDSAPAYLVSGSRHAILAQPRRI